MEVDVGLGKGIERLVRILGTGVEKCISIFDSVFVLARFGAGLGARHVFVEAIVGGWTGGRPGGKL